MPRRRNILIGLGSAAFGGGVVTAGSLTADLAAGADLGVVVESDLNLEPARENPQYVQQQDGELIVVITQLNRRARTTFAGLLQLTNAGDRRYETIHCQFRGTDGEPDPITDVLGIVAPTGVRRQPDSYALQLPDDGLGPGEATTFGIVVDLLGATETLPTGITVTLQLSAVKAAGG